MKIKQIKIHRRTYHVPDCDKSRLMLNMINRGRPKPRMSFTKADLADLAKLGIAYTVEKLAN